MTLDIENFDRQEWIFYWVTLLAAKYEQKLESYLKSEGLDIPSWRVLLHMQPDKSRSVSFLAKESAIKQSTMTRIVYRMQERDLVNINTSKEDGRVTVVTATPKGYKLRNKAWEVVKQSTNETFKDLDDKMIDKLNKNLSLVFEHLDNFQPLKHKT